MDAVPHGAPRPRCLDLTFSSAYPLGPGAEVALEDYARVVARAAAAEAWTESGPSGGLRGVHLCDPVVPPDDDVRRDVEAFARELAAPAGDRLGWS